MPWGHWEIPVWCFTATHEGLCPALTPKGPVTWPSQLGPLQSLVLCFFVPGNCKSHWRRAALSLPSHSLSETASDWLSELPKGALTRPVSKTKGRDHIWSPAAHHTGCLVRFERKLAVFSRKRIPEHPLCSCSLLQLEIWGTSVKLLSPEAGSTPTVCYGIDFHLLWCRRIWAHGGSWIHFDDVTLNHILSVAGTAEASNVAWEYIICSFLTGTKYRAGRIKIHWDGSHGNQVKK